MATILGDVLYIPKMGHLTTPGIIDLGKLGFDLPVRPKPGIMVSKGNYPNMADISGLVKYVFICPDIFINS